MVQFYKSKSRIFVIISQRITCIALATEIKVTNFTFSELKFERSVTRCYIL